MNLPGAPFVAAGVAGWIAAAALAVIARRGARVPRDGGLSRGDVVLVAVICALALGIGGIGAWASFAKVADMADKHQWASSWMVPIGVDLGILFANLADFVAIKIERPVRWFRWFALALIVGTIALNVQGETDPFGQLSHALLPAIYAAIIEGARCLITRDRGVAARKAPPLVRWLHAPLESWRVWRAMCREDLDYRTAVHHHRTQRVIRAELVTEHGSWLSVPKGERLRYRLGALSPREPLPVAAALALSPRSSRAGTRRPSPKPTAVGAPVTLADGPSPSPVTVTPNPAAPGPSPATPPARHSATSSSWFPASVDEDTWVAAGLEIHDDLAAGGQPFNRDTVKPGLAARDLPSGKNEQRAELVRRVKAQRAQTVAVTVTASPGRNGSTPPAVTLS